jgi:hypothetical protein
MNFILSLLDKAAKKAMLVCPQRPKMCFTPLASRYFTNCGETGSFIPNAPSFKVSQPTERQFTSGAGSSF